MKICIDPKVVELISLFETPWLTCIRESYVENRKVSYLYVTGTELRKLIEEIFDNVWLSRFSQSEKQILCEFGWSLVHNYI